MGVFDERPKNCISYVSKPNGRWGAIIEMPPCTKLIMLTRGVADSIILSMGPALKPEFFEIDESRVGFNVKIPRLTYSIYSTGYPNSDDELNQSYNMVIFRSGSKYNNTNSIIARLNYPNIYSRNWTVCLGSLYNILERSEYRSPKANIICETLINLFWTREFNTDLLDTMTTTITENPLQSFTISSMLNNKPSLFLNFNMEDSHPTKQYLEMLPESYSTRGYHMDAYDVNSTPMLPNITNINDIWNGNYTPNFTNVEIYKDGIFKFGLMSTRRVDKDYIEQYNPINDKKVFISQEEYNKHIKHEENEIRICEYGQLKLFGSTGIKNCEIGKTIIRTRDDKFLILIGLKRKTR